MGLSVGGQHKSSERPGPDCLTGLMVCAGKDCRKSKGWDALVGLAAGTGSAKQVLCQDICKGPVVGMHVHGDVRWFKRVRSGSARSAVLEMVASNRIPADLRDREVKKRRGLVRSQNRIRQIGGGAQESV